MVDFKLKMMDFVSDPLNDLSFASGSQKRCHLDFPFFVDDQDKKFTDGEASEVCCVRD